MEPMLRADYPCSAGSIRFLVHESQVLHGNRYDDPTLRQHPVYLPPSYATEPDRRFPVLFVLAGYTSTGLHLVGPGTFSESLPARLDRLILEGTLPECIVVAPDCMNRLGGSQYRNGAAGRYADLIVEELVPLVDRELRTTGPEAGRAVFGKSSGGFGALWLGMEHPDVFPVVASHSGDAGFEISALGEIPTLVRCLDRYPGDDTAKVEAFLTDFWAKPKRSYAEGHALMMLACASAYSPDPDQPLGFRLPCDAHTGRLLPEVWERWLAHDPVRAVETHADGLRTLRALYVECGSRDQYGLQLGARQLHEELERRDIAHRYEEFDDDHSNTGYRYDVSLPWLVGALQGRAT